MNILDADNQHMATIKPGTNIEYGLYQFRLKLVTAGAFTSGTFRRGEPVTQANSNAKGEVTEVNTAGTDSITVKVTAGAFDTTNLVTGSLSAATMTPASLEAESAVTIPIRFADMRSLAFGFAAPPNGFEELFAEKAVAEGYHFTLKRQARPVILQTQADEAAFENAADDWIDVPVGICPVAATITALRVYSQTTTGGPPLINLGRLTGGNVKDADYFVTTANALAMPASGEQIVHANPVVGAGAGQWAGIDAEAGDLLLFSTVNGTGTDPTGLLVQVELLPKFTPDLQVWYQYWGI